MIIYKIKTYQTSGSAVTSLRPRAHDVQLVLFEILDKPDSHRVQLTFTWGTSSVAFQPVGHARQEPPPSVELNGPNGFDMNEPTSQHPYLPLLPSRTS